FFQAEDGIRDGHVTGVQTCALPIWSDQIVLELLPDGSYAINRQPVPFVTLDAKFHELYDQRPAKLLFIKSAPNRKYGDIVRAMDVAKGAGVQVIGFTPAEPAAH